ncbi:hypothetical protein HU200_038663 [Digitaria exilis]|uniref:Heparan-alpha-glucosaminide N-acetyltransferase catalytic domain-containing protein n=1 Tax=Digitaria exilis TaxID=1010633 RepID=A0A835BBE4_9POAL|nr:hypothetical protein HU200_038663 [Digitaria exilis]
MDGNAGGRGGGALPGGGGSSSAALCCRQRRTAAAAAMGGYELVRSDDAAGPDLESGAAAATKAAAATSPAPAARQPRLVSLDVFRGITVLLMIIVDDAGGFVPALNHSPWDGLTIADFVMPFFLFIVGVALTLAYKVLDTEITNTTFLFILCSTCCFYAGGFFHGVHSLSFGVDLTKIRLMGILQVPFLSKHFIQNVLAFPVLQKSSSNYERYMIDLLLQRIAIAYLVAAICEIWLKGDDDVDSGLDLLRRYRYQLFVGLVLSFTYTVLLYGIYVPDWEYQISGPDSIEKSFSVKCGIRGDTGPACNAVGMVDRTILGIDHLYRRPVYARTKECSINYPENGPLPPDAPSWCQAPFDPEGLLSMLAVAFLMDIAGMHMNKPLYTMSYTLATAGAGGLLFAGIYTLVDVYGFRRPTFTMEWMGKHALMIYVLVACNILPMFIRGFYWRDPNNSLLKFIGVGA